MMNVLDALRYRLGELTDAEGRQLDPSILEMIGRGPQRSLPPGLPLGVQDQIRNQPSYGEGEIMAPGQWWNPAESDVLRMIGPQREDRLAFDRGQAQGILNPYVEDDPLSRAMPEGGTWSSRPAGTSPFASPLNQLLQLGRRAPLAMY